MTNQQGTTVDSSVPLLKTKYFYEWIEQNIPDQSGRVAMVTGANTGLGFWAAYALANKGATVVLACRNETKARNAMKEITSLLEKKNGVVPKLDFIQLDNASFDSVKQGAFKFNEKYDRLDILLNNAGVMAQKKTNTKDGYDVQIQINHLSHFLLTSLVMNKLIAAGKTGTLARVVQQSSGASYVGRPKFDPKSGKLDDGKMGSMALRMLPKLGSWKRYGQSKLANVLFATELDRRLKAAQLDQYVQSNSCHPGFCATELQMKAAQQGNMPAWAWVSGRLAQSPQDGSLNILMAATAQEVKGGAFVEPKNGKLSGLPAPIVAKGYGGDKSMSKYLWEKSVEITAAEWEI